MRRLVLLFGLLLSLTAQAQRPEWKHFIGRQMIATLAVGQGKLWASTVEGFWLQIDTETGTQTLQYISDTGLPANYFRVLGIDRSGRPWVWVRGYGLFVFENGQWKDRTPDQLDTFDAFFVDREGHVWVGGRGSVARYDGDAWEIYRSGIPQFSVRALIHDTLGHLWIGGGSLVAVFDGTRWRYFDFADSLGAYIVSSLAVDQTGHIWAAINGKGVAVFRDSSWTVYTPANSGLPNRWVHQVLIDSRGRVWVNAENELVMFDGFAWHRYTEALNLDRLGKNMIALDENDRLWIGTHYGVLEVGDTYHHMHYVGDSTLVGTSFSALAVDHQGRVWAGGNGGLFVFDGNGWTNSNPELTWISALAVDAQGRILVGTHTEGLAVYDGSRWTQYIQELPDRQVLSLAADQTGKIWAGVFRGKVVTFDGTDWTVYDSTNSPIPPAPIYALAVDRSGTVWIGTNDRLITFDGTDWQVYTAGDLGGQLGSVRQILPDEAGRIWVATSKGLMCFDGSTWTRYTPRNIGLPRTHVEAIARDADGRLWLSVGSTLAVFDGTFWEFISPPLSYHARIMESTRALTIDTGGHLWIGGEGLLVYRKGGVLLQEMPLPEVSDQPLLTSFPNPFTTQTTVTFELNRPGRVRLAVFDVLGRELQVLLDGPATPGRHTVVWDASGYPAGVYFYRLIVNGQSFTGKMLHLR